MKRVDAVRALTEYSAEQWGLVTTAQAQVVGVHAIDFRRLSEAGLVEKVGRGVYLVAGASPPEHLELKVAWLRLAPGQPAWERLTPEAYGGVVSHGSACELHRVGDLPISLIEISVPRRRTTREPGVVLHLSPIPESDTVLIGGLPGTSLPRTVTDLLAARTDAGHIGGVIVDALHRGLLDPLTLTARIAPFAARYGLPKDGDLLAYLIAQAGQSR